jgi:ribosome-associated protein
MDSLKLAQLVAQGMEEKKGSNIVMLDLRKVPNSIADFFVICSGTSDTQVDAISDSVEEFVFKNTKEQPFSREGKRNREWILIDYVDVVAHVFKNEKREFYGIENLWGDAEMTEFGQA